MTILDRLERSFARFAIPGIIRYVVGLNALVFILISLNPGYESMLTLDRTAILQGEVWRIVSWVFIPNTTGLIWILFYLLFTWWLGDLLEQNWGTFRLNAYYLLGLILCVASALIFGASGGNLFLNLSLFLAVATLAPNMEILLFLILPVKMKWIALVSLIIPIGALIVGSLAEKMIVIMCLGNYLIFFGPTFFRNRIEAANNQRRRERFEAAKLPAADTLHRCTVCGITEDSDPNADFRVANDGNEYCWEHLPKI